MLLPHSFVGRAGLPAPLPATFRQVMSIADCVIVVDAEGCVSLLNPTAEELTGWSCEKARTLPLTQVLQIDADRQGSALEIVPDRPGELRGRLRRQGKTLPVEGTVTPMMEPAGQAGGAVITLRDVSEARRMEILLRESVQRFRGAFEFAPIGMALEGIDGRWLRVNHALCKMVGFTEEELLERTFQDITHPDDLAEDLSLLARLLDGSMEAYAEPIDAAVTDVVMPGMSSRELRDRLLAARPQLRILYVSGYTANTSVEKDPLQGGALYLAKPYSPEILAVKLRELLTGAPR